MPSKRKSANVSAKSPTQPSGGAGVNTRPSRKASPVKEASTRVLRARDEPKQPAKTSSKRTRSPSKSPARAAKIPRQQSKSPSKAATAATPTKATPAKSGKSKTPAKSPGKVTRSSVREKPTPKKSPAKAAEKTVSKAAGKAAKSPGKRKAAQAPSKTEKSKSPKKQTPKKTVKPKSPKKETPKKQATQSKATKSRSPSPRKQTNRSESRSPKKTPRKADSKPVETETVQTSSKSKRSPRKSAKSTVSTEESILQKEEDTPEVEEVETVKEDPSEELSVSDEKVATEPKQQSETEPEQGEKPEEISQEAKSKEESVEPIEIDDSADTKMGTTQSKLTDFFPCCESKKRKDGYDVTDVDSVENKEKKSKSVENVSEDSEPLLANKEEPNAAEASVVAESTEGTEPEKEIVRSVDVTEPEKEISAKEESDAGQKTDEKAQDLVLVAEASVVIQSAEGTEPGKEIVKSVDVTEPEKEISVKEESDAGQKTDDKAQDVPDTNDSDLLQVADEATPKELDQEEPKSAEETAIPEQTESVEMVEESKDETESSTNVEDKPQTNETSDLQTKKDDSGDVEINPDGENAAEKEIPCNAELDSGDVEMAENEQVTDEPTDQGKVDVVSEGQEKMEDEDAEAAVDEDKEMMEDDDKLAETVEAGSGVDSKDEKMDGVDEEGAVDEEENKTEEEEKKDDKEETEGDKDIEEKAVAQVTTDETKPPENDQRDDDAAERKEDIPEESKTEVDSEDKEQRDEVPMDEDDDTPAESKTEDAKSVDDVEEQDTGKTDTPVNVPEHSLSDAGSEEVTTGTVDDVTDTQQTEDYTVEGKQDANGEKTETQQQSEDFESLDFDTDEFESDSQEVQRMLAEKRAQKGEKVKPVRPTMRSKWSDTDTWEYRNHYPGKEDDPTQNKNLLFYQNKISSRPDGGRINEIHDNWWGNYRKLESHHGYIQWLFPIREKGMNYQSQELQNFEAEAIRNDEDAKKRVLKSYEMMLDFYGIRLVDAYHGKMERAKNWKERFNHLNWSFHNYLRITRILKCLGEMGYEHLKAPFIQFMIHEAYVENTLPSCRRSCTDYWVQTLRSDEERRRLVDLAEEYEEKYPSKSSKSSYWR